MFASATKQINKYNKSLRTYSKRVLITMCTTESVNLPRKCCMSSYMHVHIHATHENLLENFKNISDYIEI